MNRNSKPRVVRRGSVAVKIYEVNNRSGDTDYLQFVVAWRDADGQRRLRKFSDETEARTEAELTATKLAAGEGDVLTLTSSDRTQYLAARSIADRLGVPLVSAVEDYAAAKGLLPAGTHLLSAIEFFKSRHQGSDLSVAEAVRRYLDSRKAAGCCGKHLSGLEAKLGLLTEAFVMPLSGLTLEDLRRHVELLQNPRHGLRPLAPRTRRNHIKSLKGFLRHAVRQRWVSRGWTEDLEALELPESLPGPIQVFAPTELERLLVEAERSAPALIPYLAIGGFAGLRTAELHRLDWGHVDFDEGYIEVTARNAKVRGRRRLVPMGENLKAWLKPLAREHGLVLPEESRLGHLRTRVAADAGVLWRHNALRHSFISYRCAITKNVAQVSYEAGNSPAIIHTHYLNVRRESEAVAWFGMKPKDSEPSSQSVVEVSDGVTTYKSEN